MKRHFTKVLWQVVVCWLALIGLVGSPASAQTQQSAIEAQVPPAPVDLRKTTTWLVVRHAEREGEADALSPAGQERAIILQRLGEIFNVDAVYSTAYERTQNTARPLAEARELTIQDYSQTSAEWYAKLREQHAGGVVLIVGHSNTAGVIAGALAKRESELLAHDEYDTLFVVTTHEASGSAGEVRQGSAESSAIVRIKFGPSSKGAPAAPADKMGPIKTGK